ncbi:transposase [Staphylococcus aureus]|nr:transposase [Staphylococcus aureus]
MSSDTNSLAHTKWNCKYHIVFAPKYRRQVIYGKIKKDVGIILRQLCERKGVEIIEAEACKDSYPYVSKYSTQTWGIIICWLFKRKK